MKKDLVRILEEALKRLGVETVSSIEIEVPRQESMGDLATPVAMSLTKSLKKSPVKIAEDMVNAIEDKAFFEKIEIAGPGFVNFTFSKEYLYSGLKDLLKLQGDFLRCNIGQGKRIQIEFVSANPTGPLHLGHGKGARLYRREYALPVFKNCMGHNFYAGDFLLNFLNQFDSRHAGQAKVNK